MSLSIFSTLAAMMTVNRRSDDPEDGNGNEAITRLAKQVAPMVVVSMLTAGGIHMGPMGQDVMGGRAEIQALMIETAKLRGEMTHLTERISDISARRTAQVDTLEKRILACELEIARRAPAQKQGMPM